MRTLALLSAAVLLAVANAPVDQYFGKLKMSALRIRYEVVSIRDRYEMHKILPEEAQHLALLTQDAFDDWARKYPKDTWLASTGYMFAKVYAELPGPTARDRAVALFTFVKSHFPNTRYAGESRDALHRGLPVRPDPAWAAERRASPTPAESPAPSGSTSAKPSASAASSSAPSASAASSPAPSASAASSPAPSPSRRGAPAPS